MPGRPRVIPKPAATFVGTQVELLLFGEVPDLNLRAPTQVDSRVGQSDRFVFDQQFNIAELFISGQIGAVPSLMTRYSRLSNAE